MSITAIYSVFCDGSLPDGSDCPQWVAEALTREAARRAARDNGWSLARLEHLCPACTARRAEEVAAELVEVRQACRECGGVGTHDRTCHLVSPTVTLAEGSHGHPAG